MLAVDLQKGNPGGPGNPFARRVAAANLLLSYTIGQPMAATDPDRLDLDEQHLAREIQDADESDRLAELLRLGLPC